MSEVNSYYTIEETSQIESKHLSKSLLEVSKYLNLIRQQQLQINDLSEKSEQIDENSSMLKYQHAKHKFRIQAFLIKQVKKETQLIQKLVLAAIERFK